MNIGAIPSSGGVEAAIRRASNATGVDADFLVRTARRESAMNPSAKARTSSAAGLFQFIEQTWLGTVKAHGAKHGYGQYADLIYRGGDGRWRVEGSARNVVLDLRFDPQAASTMAAELTASNAAYLRGRSGREPGAGDLYAAHFLGPAGAAQLMDAMDRRPGSPAAAIFPEAASANRSIFYRDGRPATVAEVHANLQRSAGDGAPAAASGSGQTAPDLTERDQMLAARLDRLKQDQSLLALLLGQDGEGKNGGFGGAFGPEAETRI
ncbi:MULTISPECIES: transglycosylase SLT domain-containing protein [unclassified Brevundimonas]|uniref:transglycosylase SLT domain-containing protein n=1 Tax=unclassified Brevundimonas TaxID=2622653 RepID=UPI0006FB4715|nr:MULTISPECIES: transglycosylase SLT domain-containing protein [unclassified Brevundimonas]KQY84430.1 lytic transglycosylase [Brevundimonas sp. Root1423]KRA19755.1 lytic transglycosylase [Brevundimonas sp. Root608]